MVPSMDPIFTFFIHTNFNLCVIRTHLLKCNKLSQLVMESIKKRTDLVASPGVAAVGCESEHCNEQPKY